MSRQKAIETLFEDQYLLVVNKPAGLLSIPGRNPEIISVFALFKDKYADLHIVHRLDKDTSGVLVFAKDPETHRLLSAEFEGKTVSKCYHAIVRGRPAKEEFTIEAKLHIDSHGKVAVAPAGKPSFTACKVIETFARYSLLEVHPLTGRQHQIRVHLAHVGHPLVVDPLYGSHVPLTIADIKPGISIPEQGALLMRTPLHALHLTLVHPYEGGEKRFEAPLPKDMQATLKQLRRWSK